VSTLLLHCYYTDANKSFVLNDPVATLDIVSFNCCSSTL
jgi:hypothetical protein